MRAALFQMLLPLVLSGCGEAPMKEAASIAGPQQKNDRPVGGPCEDCDLMFEGMPPIQQIPTTVVLAGKDEPGERLELQGRIVRLDGTPAPDGTVLYLYHTDATGRYTRAEGQREGMRHGRLRGWVRPDAQGHFQVKSIRPVSHPDSRIPQHIHMLVKEPGLSRYWIDDILFDDDPFLTKAELAHVEQRGGDLVIHLERSPENVWTGQPTITLGKNIPDYR
jgi:protocatechuate 3,4-dioxygenase, beta subunit